MKLESSSGRWCCLDDDDDGAGPYVLHELLADRSDLLGAGGGEHHDLLLVGSGAEDLLHVAAHV